MDNITNLVLRTRSYRRFKQAQRVEQQTLADLVDLARQTASAGNRQPLRYMLFHTKEACAMIFPHLKWAALLKDWDGPAEGERPAAYVMVLNNKADGGMPQCDAGIAMQTLLLAATARGLGGCMLGAIDRPKLMTACRVPEELEILFLVALGHAAETVVIEESVGSNINYYRDARGTHHIPKRPLCEVLLEME